MPHIIRLRGPWNFQPVARFVAGPDNSLIKSTENLPPGGTTELQSSWNDIVGADFQGIVQFTRRFHCPTGLAADSKVWLVVENFAGPASVKLNDRELGSTLGGRGSDPAINQRCPARLEISDRLQSQNILAITATRTRTETGELIGLVRLEIE